MTMNFKDRLAQLRKELGLTQSEFAKKINMTQQRISAYEKGKREPDIETLKQFAIFFDCTIDYITGKSNYRNDEEYNVLKIKEKLLKDEDFRQKLFVSYYKDIERIRKEKEQTECKSECSNRKLQIATTLINITTLIILLIKLFN